ncbi:MAG: ABC transporter permease [Acholeplasma sp.]|nr:ABC transporter permease [Acholeplasma sp.]
MYDLKGLILRNVKTFLRDKAAVFFSFLSVIILLGLYFLFIGKQYTSGTEFNGISDPLKTYLSTGVIMGGVLVINTVSLSLGVMGNIVTDLEQKKLEGFLVTPVRRYKIVLAYYISSILVTFILTLVMWFITILYIGISTGYWYSFETITLISLLILLYTFVSSSLMIFLVTLLKTTNAFGTLAGILGTVIGFISGIYMPLEVLGKGMANVASLVPFSHMTIWMKQIILKGAYSELDPMMVKELEVFYGTLNIGVLGNEVGTIWIVLGIALLSLGLLVLSYRNMSKKLVK